MFVVVRKKNILFIGLLFLLIAVVFSINFIGAAGSGGAKPVSRDDVSLTVLLDPGHGGEDPGAVSDYSGIKEKDINLIIAFKLKALLENDGYKVIMTRTEDVLLYSDKAGSILEKRRDDLQRRKKMMDDVGVDIVISLHLNKFPETIYHGAQTFYAPNSPESNKLAISIQKAIKEFVDTSNTREALVKKQQIVILKNLKTVTAIVECGFLSNEAEEKLLATDAYQEKLALGIKKGIDSYFGKKK